MFFSASERRVCRVLNVLAVDRRDDDETSKEEGGIRPKARSRLLIPPLCEHLVYTPRPAD